MVNTRNLIIEILTLIIAVLIVNTASSIFFGVSPISEIGNFSWSNIKAIGIGLLIFIFLIFGGGFWAISRAEKNELANSLRQRYGRMIWNRLKMSADRGMLSWIPFMGGGWIKRETEEGMMPPIVREELHIFHLLTGYMKRLFIFFSKWNQVKVANTVIGKARGELSIFKDEKVLISQIEAYRTGGDILTSDEEGNLTVSGHIDRGLFGTYEDLMKTYNNAFDIIDQQIKDIKRGAVNFGPFQAQKLKTVGDNITNLTANLSAYSEELMRRVKVYGNHHVIRGWMYLVFDQVNPSGEKWPHNYFFVRKGTMLVDRFGHESEAEEAMTEVDVYGNIMEDTSTLKDQFGNLPEPFEEDGSPNPDYDIPRMVKNPLEIINHPNPHKVTALIDTEWQGFIQDLRAGQFHPYSTAWEDYEHFINSRKKFYDDKLVHDSTHLPSRKDGNRPAFDKEALKNPGKFVYWGRRKYDDTLLGIEEKNPYPTLTTRGMTLYLHEVVEKDMASAHEAHEWLTRFIGDTGEWSTNPKDAPKTIDLMSKVAKKEG